MLLGPDPHSQLELDPGQPSQCESGSTTLVPTVPNLSSGASSFPVSKSELPGTELSNECVPELPFRGVLSAFECYTDLSPWEHSWPLLHPSSSERWWSQTHVTGHSSCPEQSLYSPEYRTSQTPAKATKNCKTDWIRRQCCGTVTIFYGSGSSSVSRPQKAQLKKIV